MSALKKDSWPDTVSREPNHLAVNYIKVQTDNTVASSDEEQSQAANQRNHTTRNG